MFVIVLSLISLPVMAKAPEPACALGLREGGKAEQARVRRVIDGDTLILSDGRHVRLIGVNTPELGRQGRPDQPLAREARDAVLGFIADRPVKLIWGRDSRDDHGRYLAHVYSRSGESLEASLLARGLAWHVAVPPNLSSADCFAGLERKARAARLGVWREYQPVPVQALTEGGYQRLTGRVESLVFAGAWWINFDGPFSAVIYPEYQKNFDRRTLSDMKGRQVQLAGWVYRSPSGSPKPWRLKLETPYALGD
ncbi:MAG: nuclease [Porticoccaceae bacterium]|nr:nuclease [Porticoccaceae bacterium]